jgi:hypothetical protein
MPRKHIPTSKEAHDSVKEHKEIFYEKILTALEKMKVGGTSEEVSVIAGIEYAQCHKRLPELIGMGKVYNTGYTRKNSSGRAAMVRQLVNMKSDQE